MNGESHFSIKAILIGWLVDTLSGLIFGMVLRLIILFIYQFTTAHSADSAEIEAKFETLTHTFEFLIFELSFGLIFTMIGGFVTAYFAKESIIKHCISMGSLSLATGLLMMSYLDHTMPLWYWIAGAVLTIPAAVLGGYVYTVMKEDFFHKDKQG